MGFYTRTKQPIVGIIAEALGFNDETNALEVGTNLEVDGGLFANSLSVFRSRVEMREQLIIGNTSDGFYREITNNQETVWFFENYPQNVFRTIYGYDDLDDSFFVQREGSNAQIRNNVKSFFVNGQEVITDIQAVINNGTPQLNLKQGYGNNIVRTCDLTPVLSNAPLSLGEYIDNSTVNAGAITTATLNIEYSEENFQNLSKLIKDNRLYGFSLGNYQADTIYTLSKKSDNLPSYPYPLFYFTSTYVAVGEENPEVHHRFIIIDSAQENGVWSFRIRWGEHIIR